MGFCCPLPIGKLQRQRSGEKKWSLLFKNYVILEEWQASASEPTPSRTPRKKPCHPFQTNPGLCPEFLLPFKIPSFWETTGCSWAVLQTAYLLSLLLSSLRILSGVCMHSPHLLPQPPLLLIGAQGPPPGHMTSRAPVCKGPGLPIHAKRPRGGRGCDPGPSAQKWKMPQHPTDHHWCTCPGTLPSSTTQPQWEPACTGQARGRWRSVSSFPVLNLPAQTFMCYGSVQHPSQSHSFRRLDWRVCPSPCCHANLYGTHAAVTCGFPSHQELEAGRRAFPLSKHFTSLSQTSLPQWLLPAVSLPGVRESVVMCCYPGVVSGVMCCCH